MMPTQCWLQIAVCAPTFLNDNVAPTIDAPKVHLCYIDIFQVFVC